MKLFFYMSVNAVKNILILYLNTVLYINIPYGDAHNQDQKKSAFNLVCSKNNKKNV